MCSLMGFENAKRSCAHYNSAIFLLSADTQWNLRLVAVLFLKTMATLKFEKILGANMLKEYGQAIWAGNYNSAIFLFPADTQWNLRLVAVLFLKTIMIALVPFLA
jgi:hypothetical protein